MEQVQTQSKQGTDQQGVALWNKQQWQDFMDHAKAVAPQVTGKADDKNPMRKQLHHR